LIAGRQRHVDTAGLHELLPRMLQGVVLIKFKRFRIVTMRLFVFLCCAIMFWTAAALPRETEKRDPDAPVIGIFTNHGAMECVLFPEQSPLTVKNFLAYVDESFYDLTLFDRCMPGYLIQGGGFTPNMMQLPTKAPIENEAANGLLNKRGTIAMARALDPHSATCVFYINLADNEAFDQRDETEKGFGYTVFGKLIRGLDVADEISNVETKRMANVSEALPLANVIIDSVRVLR